MNQNKDYLCKGCSMNIEIDGYICYFTDKNKQELCPCINCLVKIMCVNVTCKQRIDSINQN